MKRALLCDKSKVVEILLHSFADNKSVNYIIKQDAKKLQRIKKLMEYSFDVCSLFGEVYITTDENACALVLYPDKKRTSLKSILLDVKLILYSTGFANVLKAMKREAEVKEYHPRKLLYYLWFIGVKPEQQNKGIGTTILKELIQDSFSKERILCLETSVDRNIPWYQKNGLVVYKELDFGYRLYCMKTT